MSKYSSAITTEKVINFVKDSKSISEVIRRCGLSSVGSPHYRLVNKIVKENNIDLSHFTGSAYNKGRVFPERTRKTLEAWLLEDTYIGSSALKKKLFKVGIFKEKCSNCGLTDWLGETPPLELDHINGINTDNRLDNLRILCANCHAKTSNYCGKNKEKYKAHLLKLANRTVLNTVVEKLPGSSPGVGTKYCIDCGKTICRRAKRCNACNHPTKIQWPSKEELLKLVWEKPSSLLAVELGVSDKAIDKRCKLFGIDKPPRGYWTRRKALTLEQKDGIVTA